MPVSGQPLPCLVRAVSQAPSGWEVGPELELGSLPAAGVPVALVACRLVALCGGSPPWAVVWGVWVVRPLGGAAARTRWLRQLGIFPSTHARRERPSMMLRCCFRTPKTVWVFLKQRQRVYSGQVQGADSLQPKTLNRGGEAQQQKNHDEGTGEGPLLSDVEAPRYSLRISTSVPPQGVS